VFRPRGARHRGLERTARWNPGGSVERDYVRFLVPPPGQSAHHRGGGQGGSGFEPERPVTKHRALRKTQRRRLDPTGAIRGGFGRWPRSHDGRSLLCGRCGRRGLTGVAQLICGGDSRERRSSSEARQRFVKGGSRGIGRANFRDRPWGAGRGIPFLALFFCRLSVTRPMRRGARGDEPGGRGRREARQSRCSAERLPTGSRSGDAPPPAAFRRGGVPRFSVGSRCCEQRGA